MRTDRQRLNARRCIAAGLLGFVVATAPANFIQQRYMSETDFNAEIANMPDLDQRRAQDIGIFGLPNDGAMYCVPTSTMNLFLYAANHGFPEIEPGPIGSFNDFRYNNMTIEIITLGQMMGTDPVGGTGGGGTAVEDWLADTGRLVTSTDYANGTHTPKLRHLAKAVADGSIVNFAYGRYSPMGTSDGATIWGRNGGHAITLTKAYRNGFDNQYVRYRDPADDAADLTSQSPYTSREVPVDDLWMLVQDGNDLHYRFHSVLNYTQGDTIVRPIDCVRYVTPKSAYSWVASPAGAVVKRRTTYPMNWPQSPSEVNLSDRTLDLAMGPCFEGFYELMQGIGGLPNSLRRVDQIGGQAELIGTLPTIRRLAFGRQHELYGMGSEVLRCYELDPNFAMVSQRTLSIPGNALAYDDATDRVYVLSTSQKKIARFPKRLAGSAEVFTLPTQFTMSGDGWMSFNPADGSLWLGSAGSNRLIRGSETMPGVFSWGEVLLPAVQNVGSFDFDDRGHLFISSNSVIREFAPEGSGWIEVIDSPFAGAPAGNGLRVARHRTNYDAAVHEGPGWTNLQPDEAVIGTPIPDRKGDLNCDGHVDFFDIDPLVVALGGGSAYELAFPTCNWLNGDFTGDGAVDFFDIDPFVAALDPQ